MAEAIGSVGVTRSDGAEGIFAADSHCFVHETKGSGGNDFLPIRALCVGVLYMHAYPFALTGRNDRP